MLYFVLKNIIEMYSIKSKNFIISFVLLYISILLRSLIQIVSGLIQISNEFISIKAIYFLVIIYSYKTIIFVLERLKRKNNVLN